MTTSDRQAASRPRETGPGTRNHGGAVRRDRRAGAAQSGRRRPPGRRWSSGARITLALVLVVVTSLGLLAAALVLSAADHDWHAAVTINGIPIDRADFRNRATVLDALAAARTELLTRLSETGVINANDAAEIQARVTGQDPVTATVDSLARERVVRAEATTAGIASPAVDPWGELAAAVAEQLSRHVRWFAITGPLATTDPSSPASDWPRAPDVAASAAVRSAARDAALARASADLPAHGVSDLVAAARGAGWDAHGGETWIPDSGQIAGMPDVLAAGLRDASAGASRVVGPVVDEVGGEDAVAILIAQGPAPDAAAARRAAAGIHVDDGALRAWAEGRVLERLLEAQQTALWTTTPSVEVSASEVVIGAAANGGVPGPSVGLAHLVTSRLPASDLPPADPGASGPSGTPATALANELRALPLDARLARWDALVAAANQGTTADPLTRSGEMGWLSKDALAPTVSAAAFAPGVTPGSILGPIATARGEELFLLRGQYPGTLDDRAAAALTEVLTTADLGSVAARIAPAGEGARFDPGIVRDEHELGANDPARHALLEGALDQRTQPYVLDGEILVAVPHQRVSAVPTGQALARIRVVAFDAWIAERLGGLTITIDPNPFGLPSAGPSPTAPPTAPAAPTPITPLVPGLSTGPRTDDLFALPTMPPIPGQASAVP